MGRIYAHATEGIPSLPPPGTGRRRGERSGPGGASVLGRTRPALSAFLTSEFCDETIGELKDQFGIDGIDRRVAVDVRVCWTGKRAGRIAGSGKFENFIGVLRGDARVAIDIAEAWRGSPGGRRCR